MTKLIEKKKSHAFKKDVYLLGILNGEQIWLEAPSWDCGWYWGFGYIETYTGTNPATSRDITSHTHYNSLCFNSNNKEYKFIHILEDLKGLEACTLTRDEQWILSDLMKSFYTLKESAEIFYKGNSHYASSTGVDLKNEDYYNKINKELIPAITARIIELLTPNN